MYPYNTSKNRSQQQWAFLTRRLQRLINNKKFTLFSRKKQQFLCNRLTRLYRKMLHFQSPKQLLKALGTAALLLGLGATQAVQAQVDFSPPVNNPFELSLSANFQYNTFADLDGDGDLDIFSIEYGPSSAPDDSQIMEFRKNSGSTTDASYSPRTEFQLPVPLIPSENRSYLNPEFADLDGDGDLDLLIGFFDHNGGGIVYFENTGDAQNPTFAAPQINPFGMNFSNSQIATPQVADLDGDGDLDILSAYYRYDYGDTFGFAYLENTGLNTAPSFGDVQREIFNLPLETSDLLLMDLGDIDNDGDVDILANPLSQFPSTSPFILFENTGDAGNPNFSNPVQNPFSLATAEGWRVSPMLGDLDQDGDLDLLSGNHYSLDTYEPTGWSYQENLLQTVNTDELTIDNGQLCVFPTISSGQYQLQLTSSYAEQAHLQVYNTVGQLQLQVELEQTNVQNIVLDLGQLPAGIYFLDVIQGQQRWSKTLVKK